MAMWFDNPTKTEIASVSDAPARFRRTYPVACEVRQYASTHGGRLPAFAFELSDSRWAELAQTLIELDRLAWLRRVA